MDDLNNILQQLRSCCRCVHTKAASCMYCRSADEIEQLRSLLHDWREQWGDGMHPDGDLIDVTDAALAGASSEMELVHKRQAEIDGCCHSCGRSTKRHPGYVIGNHWLESAYERICAGEAEDDVLRDYDVVRVTNQPDAVASTFADCETAMGMEYTTPPCACAEYYPGLPHHPDCPTRNTAPTDVPLCMNCQLKPLMMGTFWCEDCEPRCSSRATDQQDGAT